MFRRLKWTSRHEPLKIAMAVAVVAAAVLAGVVASGLGSS
jgi:hypothetical protein